MSTATYRVSERKCATCRWWQGARMVEFRNNLPYYVNVEAKPAPCMALKGQAARHDLSEVGEVGETVIFAIANSLPFLV